MRNRCRRNEASFFSSQHSLESEAGCSASAGDSKDAGPGNDQHRGRCERLGFEQRGAIHLVQDADAFDGAQADSTEGQDRAATKILGSRAAEIFEARAGELPGPLELEEKDDEETRPEDGNPAGSQPAAQTKILVCESPRLQTASAA